MKKKLTAVIICIITLLSINVAVYAGPSLPDPPVPTRAPAPTCVCLIDCECEDECEC